MNFNIDYLMQHISYELHTIIKNWTDTLSSQTKPEVVCARKDISDEYLPFSVFTDSILNAEDTFNLANNPLIFSAGTADQQIFYAYIAAGEKYLLIGPVVFSSFIQTNLHITCLSWHRKILLLSSAAIFIISAPMCFWPIICSVNLLLSGMISFLLIA